jgi:hypothetical protein
MDDVLTRNNSKFRDLLIASMPLGKYTTDASRCASYLVIHLVNSNDYWLRTKRQKIWLNFPIVNIPFICSNIPTAPAYGVYISQFIRYSRACGYYHNCLDRRLLITKNLLNYGFLLAKLKSWLRKFLSGHTDLVNRYGISVSQMSMDMFRLL